MYLLVDGAIRRAQPDVWPTLLAGLGSFLSQASAAGVKLTVDFIGQGCRDADHAPEISLQEPSQEPIDIAALGEAALHPSDVAQALSQGLRASVTGLERRPRRAHVAVLITNGVAKTGGHCPSRRNVLSEIASAGGRAQTYVVGIGPDAAAAYRRLRGRPQALDSVAKAGGSGRARRIEALASPDALVQTLQTVVEEALPALPLPCKGR
jgi:hypothetical protein